MKKQEQNYRVPQVSDSTVGKVRKLAADVEALTVSQAETKHKVAGATLGHHQVRWHFFYRKRKAAGEHDVPHPVLSHISKLHLKIRFRGFSFLLGEY